MSLISSVHLLKRMNNAFWNGEQMVYAMATARSSSAFTGALDVVGHELSHGVIAHTCRLEYQNESAHLQGGEGV